MVKSTKIGKNFTITFSESSHHYLSNGISFVWFFGGPNFFIIFSSDVIVTSRLDF